MAKKKYMQDVLPGSSTIASIDGFSLQELRYTDTTSGDIYICRAKAGTAITEPNAWQIQRRRMIANKLIGANTYNIEEVSYPDGSDAFNYTLSDPFDPTSLTYLSLITP